MIETKNILRQCYCLLRRKNKITNTTWQSVVNTKRKAKKICSQLHGQCAGKEQAYGEVDESFRLDRALWAKTEISSGHFERYMFMDNKKSRVDNTACTH